LAPTGDEGRARPRRAAQDACEFQQIAPLRLGERGAAMDAELGDVEPDFAQLPHHQDLEVLRRELRQFGHRSTLLGSGRYGNTPETARSREMTAVRGVASSQPRLLLEKKKQQQLRAPT